jgi:Sulfotransferase family
MAIICRQYHLLFVMTPRTACTAIGELLCNHYGGEFLPAEDILDSDGGIAVQKKHSTVAELIAHSILTATEAASLLKVATVRNPFDTLVSLYFKQRYKYQPLLADPNSWVNRSPTYAKNMRYAQTHSFNAWVLRKCRRQMAKRLRGDPPSMFHDYTDGVDVIMQYENIDSDLRDVFARVGMSTEVAIPKVNCTDERSVRDYRALYTTLARLAVRTAFSGDLRKYGYNF